MALTSLRRWPKELMPNSFKSSAVIPHRISEKLGVLFEAQSAQPRRDVHAVTLGSEEP